jgi:hypothetical protein
VRGLYNNIVNFNKINAAQFISKSAAGVGAAPVSCRVRTKINFHPSEFTTSGARKTKSFFKHALRAKLLFNLFCRSNSKFGGLYFFNVKNSSFKFRKRSNMYFALQYISSPQDQITFFLSLSRFIKFLDMISLRLFKVYGLKAGITKVRPRRGFIDIYILNAHLVEAFISNRPVNSAPRVFCLSVSADEALVQRLLHSIYRKGRFS